MRSLFIPTRFALYLQAELMDMKAEENKSLDNTQNSDKQEVLNTALEELNQLITEKPDNAGLYFARAELFFSKNDLGKASNDYRKVLELDPKNKEASGKIEYIQTILRYQNTDIYANPNTNLDPWLE